jgi:threonine dehydrogenase-like Zn-dependent dehydrogenase
VNLAKSKKYPLEKMVTHRYPLEQAEAAIQLVGDPGSENVIKAVLVP